jgi:anti-repressor protein
MSADLVQHAFHGQAVRVITDEHGDPQFVLADLCKVLDLGNPSMVASRIDSDALSLAEVIDSLGRRQQAHVVSEAGMYEVVIRSDKPEAREFRRWVTTDVLPTIRRTGSYAVPQSREQRLALAVIDAQAMLIEKDERIAVLEPAAHAWDALADSTGDYSMRDAAQILSQDPSIEIGQNRLAKYLHEVAWIDPRGIPYQHHVDVGRLQSKPQTRVSHRTGERLLCDPQVRITVKGIGALHKLLGGTAAVDTTIRHLAVVS